VRVALVSREVYPLGGGGIGQFVAAAARLLARIAEVTVITTSVFQERYERLRAAGDRSPWGEGVRVAFVPEPTVEEAEPWYHVMHCYGARLYELLAELYPDGGPDLIEFPDFLAEAFVPLQAAETLDPLLAGTTLCVRLHTSAELCEVLDGHLKRDLGHEALHAMERHCLARADRLVWQGGDVLGAYRRFYGAQRLAPAVRIRYPYAGPFLEAGDRAQPAWEGPLRILYAGRLERRKGVHNLVRAVTGMERDDLRLTVIGDDTDTAPLGFSMRALLELESAEDPRIALRPAVGRDALIEEIGRHHVVAIPSLWECWPYAALEPLHLNRPLLATPVGGLVEIVKPGRSGWLACATDPPALEDALLELVAARERLRELVQEGEPLSVAGELCREEEILDAYQALAALEPERARGGRGVRGEGLRRRRAASQPPLVSAIVPYHRAARYVREAVASLLAQTHPRLEIVLVNDGSFEEEDWVVAELAARLPVVVVTQMNQGLGAARNFGIRQSRGRYVFPLDCDNVAEPEFVARCVEVLERRPEVAYVTSWSRYIGEDGRLRPGPAVGYQPLGNQAAVLERENVAGDAAAVIRRRLFDAGFWYSEELTAFEDWALYRELAQAGHFGAVIPRRLVRYRVRDDSMQARIAQPRRARLEGEIAAHVRARAMRWTAAAGA
jgi:glycogen(starch) synthase